MIQEFVHKKSLALTAVYLITEETTEFQVLEDQNLICSLVAWFLTIVILWLQNSLTMGLNINRRAKTLLWKFKILMKQLLIWPLSNISQSTMMHFPILPYNKFSVPCWSLTFYSISVINYIAALTNSHSAIYHHKRNIKKERVNIAGSKS